MKARIDDAHYQALLARDHRFDGKFFVGVRTTGIYCRPICPARPKRENVVFFQNSLAAERAGYRPCLRCRPEAAPRSPVWIGKSAIVQRAVRLIHQQETRDLDEERFAGLFGVSARHLRRLFIEEIGKTPKQLSAENRLNLARRLIAETSLPLSEIAFGSGFRSIRRFNDAFKVRFKKCPSQIRRRKSVAGSVLSLSLPYRPPFDFSGLLRSYEAHRMGELEWFEPGKMHRVFSWQGKAGTIAISHDESRCRLIVEIDFPDSAAIHAIVSRVRSVFDLDSDPLLISDSLERDPRMRAISRRHPGVRLPSGWDGFEIAIATILGQLVSVDFGRVLVGQLVDLLGENSGLTRQGRAIRLFPTAQRIASCNLAELRGLGTTDARKKTLIAFAGAVANGEISLEPTQDVDRFIREVRAIRGIGPWTASYMALKVLRHTDSFPETDLVLARALAKEPLIAIDRFKPWRGYAAALLWRDHHA